MQNYANGDRVSAEAGERGFDDLRTPAALNFANFSGDRSPTCESMNICNEIPEQFGGFLLALRN